MLFYAYDLDGVLIDTRQATIEAYAVAGVTPPQDFYCRPWQSWTTPEVHARKSAALPQVASPHNIKALPLLDFARRHRGIILSMCSDEALAITNPMFRLYEIGTIMNKLSIQDRLEFLEQMPTAPEDSFIYFDDNAEFCELVSKHTRWQACRVYPQS